MLKTLSLISLIFFHFGIFSQTIYISTNTNGRFLVQFNNENSQEFYFEKGKFYSFKVDGSSQLNHIEFFNLSNEKSVVYQLHDIVRDGDSLSFPVKLFSCIDTTRYSAGCLDGTYQENKITTKKYNKRSPKVNELPKEIDFLFKGKYITLYLKQEEEFEICSGHGEVKGKPWGFDESTHKFKVMYSNIEPY